MERPFHNHLPYEIVTGTEPIRSQERVSMGLDLTALGRQVRQMSHNAATEAADSANRVAICP